MKTKIIILLASVGLSFCGCEIYCPEFPTEYFPYYIGQELKFINSQQNIHIFNISNKENSEPNSFRQHGKCACEIFSRSLK